MSELAYSLARPPVLRAWHDRPARLLRAHADRLLLALVAIGLFARIMTYPLQHDEQFYVPGGVLFSWTGLYSQLAFSHLPNLPLLLHTLYALPVGGYYLLVARLVICVAWCCMIAAVIMLARFFRADRVATAAMVGLIVANPLLLGPTGMAATNNMVGMSCALFGALAFCQSMNEARHASWRLALSGFLLALAAGFKINYAALIVPFAVASFLLPGTLDWRARLTGSVLPLLLGGLAGSLPTLLFLMNDPIGTYVHVIAFHRGPQIGFWLTHPDAADPKIMDLKGKLLLATQVWLSGATLVLVLAISVLAYVRIRPSDSVDRGAPLGWAAWLFGTTCLLGVLLSFIPTPAFPQYYALPLPFAVALLGALQARMTPSQRSQVRPLLIVGLCLVGLASAPALLGSIPAALKVRDWTGLKVHRDGARVRAIVTRPGDTAPLATLVPLYALEGGLRIYPSLALGPFVYRAMPFVPSAQQRFFANAVSPQTIGAMMQRDCPAGVLIGFEGELDQPLAAFAHMHGFVARPLRLETAPKAPVSLLVAPSATACGAPANPPR